MTIILLVFLISGSLCYEDIYDKLNYDAFLQNNTELLQKHLDCYLDKAVCVDPESLSAKPHLIEVFKDSCQECSQLQKHHAYQFLTALKKFLPEGYKEFQKKFDKDGKHLGMFENAVAKY